MAPHIRLFAPGDAHGAARVRTACFPYEITVPALLGGLAARTPPSARLRQFTAADGGRVVGYASAKLSLDGSGRGEAVIMVDPDHRRAGVGGALLAAAEEHLRSAGAVSVRSAGPVPAAEAFAVPRGYTARARYRHQELDLAGLPPVPPAPAGVELRPVSTYADDPRPVHEVDAAASLDEPGYTPAAPLPYDVWYDTVWRDPRVDHGLSVLVLVDGAPAGIVAWHTDGATRLVSAFTGTLRPHRGRGLAGYAKTAALHRARAAGYRTAFTANASGNAPMLAINARLGYRHTATEVLFARDL
ncbi:GNAT family N-acetyltransferase [Nocardiopsis trehalosi]|jgi:GNAT superfamily N-acetyltransferase|uniref:GNAT family N-acetyltransferase n=1 Tax=Nocardiopsis trehalosi TaxID=109329 RepID=UPI00082E695A|nr:GNAT family N-acetyltransferase [Nocardiopsis trehalosi]